MSFQGKTAVITGASSGIGLLCAQCFAEQGANIVMLATNPTKLQSKVDALTAKGYHAIGIPTDVRNYAQVADAFQKAKEAFSTIDIVINSAGGSEIRICGVERGTPFQDVPIEVFDWGLDVNLKGPFYMGHAAMKYMAEQKSGVIINIGSITGAEASCGDVAYATAKSGVMNGLTKSLALVGAPYGVRCCCVSPGPVLTRDAREGISLSRATMANWVIQCAQTWLKPLYRHMKQELLTHSVIHADETVVQVLKEDGKPATSQSRMWLYASAALLKHQVRLFEYQPDRSGKRPEAFLKGFTGALVTDGYQAYNLLTKVTHCGCWAHARRKWREAMPEGATVKTSKAAVGFQYCNKLFAQERKCAAYKPKYRQEYRQNKELPLLEEYYAWLKTLHPEKGSKLEEAVRYSLNQKQPLTAFLNNGEVPISNNLAENAIRPFTLGRKNWLFCDTTKGAEASAIVYSLVESAKANGVEPFAYLQHVLVELPYLGKNQSHEELESFMPWAPYIQQEFGVKNSDAYVNTYLD